MYTNSDIALTLYFHSPMWYISEQWNMMLMAPETYSEPEGNEYMIMSIISKENNKEQYDEDTNSRTMHCIIKKIQHCLVKYIEEF